MSDFIRCKFCDRQASDFCGHCKAPTCFEHSYICFDDGTEICPDCDELDAILEQELEDSGLAELPEIPEQPILAAYAWQVIEDDLNNLVDEVHRRQAGR